MSNSPIPPNGEPAPADILSQTQIHVTLNVLTDGRVQHGFSIEPAETPVDIAILTLQAILNHLERIRNQQDVDAVLQMAARRAEQAMQAAQEQQLAQRIMGHTAPIDLRKLRT